MITIAEIPQRLAAQRTYFNSQKTKPYQFRYHQLERLEAAVKKYEAEVFAALKSDLGKSTAEAFLGEVGFLYEELKFTKKNLKCWMKPKRVATPMTLAVGKSRIHYEPLGVSLIIAPWNYPYQLLLTPLVAAIAAGNCAAVKPSELAPATARLVSKIIEETFPPEYVWSIEGAADVSTALLKERWDHVFFTGSIGVGKIVMKAAAEHLTPVTLELGGKSPCIVDESVDMDVATRRIAWGKYLNAGQTCVAPDYLLVPKGSQQRIVEKISAHLDTFFGRTPSTSPEYSRIVSERHYDRLHGMLGQGTVVVGGQGNRAEKYLAPTLLTEPKLDSPLMQEEIFGPLLPIVEYSSFDEAVKFVQDREKPLALYYFGNDPAHRDRVVGSLSFGGGCINDTLVHLSNPRLPFGGVGTSGMGGYHGWYSFEAFSHRKSVLDRATWFDLNLRYYPYADKLPWLRRMMGS